MKYEKAYPKVIEIIARQEYIDGIIFSPRYIHFDRNVTTEVMIKHIENAEIIASLSEKYNKPMVLCGVETTLSGPVYEIYKRKHIPFFSNPLDSAKAMRGLVKYAKVLQKQA